MKSTDQVGGENTENLAFKFCFFLFLSYSHQLAASQSSLAISIFFKTSYNFNFRSIKFRNYIVLEIAKIIVCYSVKGGTGNGKMETGIKTENG